MRPSGRIAIDGAALIPGHALFVGDRLSSLQYAIAQRDPAEGGEGFDYGLVGEPRTYGVDVRYRF